MYGHLLCSKKITGFLVRYVDPKDPTNPPKMTTCDASETEQKTLVNRTTIFRWHAAQQLSISPRMIFQ